MAQPQVTGGSEGDLAKPTQYGGFPGGSVVESPPAKQETQVRFLDLKDLLEEEMATPSSILAWEIPWTEEPGGLPRGYKELDTTEATELTHS